MFQMRKKNLFLVCILTIIFVLPLTSPNTVEGQVDSLLEVQEKLLEISEEELKILQELFILVQEIEAVEREEEGITSEIKIINEEIFEIEQMIASDTMAYEKRQENLKEVLKSYQRSGAGSYLKIIFESDSLTTLLRRINTLRDITRNTGELLEQLDESKEKLSIQKTNLTDKLELIEKKQEQLRESLTKKLQVKEDIDKYLVSMKEEREYYKDHLDNIHLMWDELKPLFSEAAIEFSRIVEKGEFPPDALKISFTISGIKGSIDDTTFNNIIKEHSNLPEMIFDFYPERVEMTLPEKNLMLAGAFVILEGNTLKFEVKEGSFFGMSLEESAIEELFREGYMHLNLKPLIGSNKLRSIEILEGHIELLIAPVLF